MWLRMWSRQAFFLMPGEIVVFGAMGMESWYPDTCVKKTVKDRLG